jgi:hypothetical protein
MKHCPNCDSEVEDNFDLCWNCNFCFSENKIVDYEDNVNKEIFTKSEKPYWYKIIMILSIMPIFLWPILFFGSIFFLDDPNITRSNELLFYGFNSLPIVFIALLYLSSKIFSKHKVLSTILLVIPFIIFCSILLYIDYSL